MKYLFFFNGQPLLLCCVCCKIAIQDFLTGLHKKNKKNLRFHRRVYRRTITRRYFTESCKTITGLCHNHRRTITCQYFIELQKNYGIVPHSPTGLPMDLPTFNVRRYFTESCQTITSHTIITDGIYPSVIKYRRIYRWIISVGISQRVAKQLPAMP